jgi:lipopolysaccharide transport system permease protein
MTSSAASTEAPRVLEREPEGVGTTAGRGGRTIILEAGRAERNYWSDLWHYRELFAILAWRDVAVRYKQTVIGVAWAVVRPVATIVY